VVEQQANPVSTHTENREGHFTGEQYLVFYAVRPLYLWYLPVKRKLVNSARKGHSTGKKGHSTGEKGHSTGERKSEKPCYHWLFRLLENPNILSIDNQLIIKPHSPPMPTAAAML